MSSFRSPSDPGLLRPGFFHLHLSSGEFTDLTIPNFHPLLRQKHCSHTTTGDQLVVLPSHSSTVVDRSLSIWPHGSCSSSLVSLLLLICSSRWVFTAAWAFPVVAAGAALSRRASLCWLLLLQGRGARCSGLRVNCCGLQAPWIAAGRLNGPWPWYLPK